MDLNDWTDAQLCEHVESVDLHNPFGKSLVAELLRRYNEQGLRLAAAKVAMSEFPAINHGPIDKREYNEQLRNLAVALNAVGATAANLAKIATERNAVIDECKNALRHSGHASVERILGKLEALKVEHG